MALWWCAGGLYHSDLCNLHPTKGLFVPQMSDTDFMDGEPGVVVDGLPDLSSYVFIHSSLDDAGLDPYEFRIFCHLRRRAKDRMAWPGMRSISEVTGISLNKVCLTIRSLQNKGFLRVQKRGPSESNIYLVRSPQEHPVPDKNTPVLVENTPVPDKNTRVSIEGTPLKDKSVTVSAKPSKEELAFFVTSLGLTVEDADAIWDLWLVNGFRTKNGPIRNWQAAVRNYNRQGWLPSKQHRTNGHSVPQRDSLGRLIRHG